MGEGVHWARLIALALLSGSACASVAPPASQFPTAAAALERVRAERVCSRALRGEAQLDTFTDSGRLRASAFFLVEHPEQVRLDVLSPLGGPLATLTSDGQAFALLDQKAKAFTVGRANQCNVERFLGVPVPAGVLVQLLTGEAPVLVHEPGQAEISWDDGRYVVRIRGKHDSFEELELEPHPDDFDKPYQQQRLRLVAVRVEQAGVELYRAELRDYTRARTARPRVDPLGLEPPVPASGPECSAEVPRRIRFTVPLSEQDVVFAPKQVEHNPPLLPGTFSQSRPGGARLVLSPCQ
jgi:hypothetical protein